MLISQEVRLQGPETIKGLSEDPQAQPQEDVRRWGSLDQSVAGWGARVSSCSEVKGEARVSFSLDSPRQCC